MRRMLGMLGKETIAGMARQRGKRLTTGRRTPRGLVMGRGA
ncbi:hypothetical protein CSHISOI_09986 [Colletotrichum shisoi]|uniref:Uncharacterized protein n=1 Tax=Colletotrichum shisoi TaxID=2078593 RepID=A0A5Q4BD34_9PEZI|nr:hypothetical protein CSHISOI_09986 [Colletotrichum shisoi]